MHFLILKRNFMKSLLFIFIFLCSFCFGQTLHFDEINSQNVLDIIFPKENIATAVASGNISIQEGNYNIINVQDNNLKKLKVTQNGDFNTFQYNNFGKTPTDATVNMVGANNYIDITGNNSIMEGLKINLRMNDKMIFIRNY